MDLAPIGAGIRNQAREKDGGRHRTRTCDILRIRQAWAGCKVLRGNVLHGGVNPVTPNVTPDLEIDPKERLLEALRGVDRETLLAVITEALTGKGPVHDG